MTTDNYIDALLDMAEGGMYCDFCRMLVVIWWNM